MASSARTEQWIFTGGSRSSFTMSVFLILAASSTVLPLSHSVARLEGAIPLPPPPARRRAPSRRPGCPSRRSRRYGDCCSDRRPSRCTPCPSPLLSLPVDGLDIDAFLGALVERRHVAQPLHDLDHPLAAVLDVLLGGEPGGAGAE